MWSTVLCHLKKSTITAWFFPVAYIHVRAWNSACEMRYLVHVELKSALPKTCGFG